MVIHTWTGGVMKEDRLIRQIVEIVLVHLTRQQKSDGSFKARVFNTYVACDLAVSADDRLKSREVAGVSKYFCHRRLLGESRPLISNDEIDKYIQLMDREIWSFQEFMGFSHIRMFDSSSCNCCDFSQYRNCHHIQSRLFAENVIPKSHLFHLV
jgi:hypothetical protein